MDRKKLMHDFSRRLTQLMRKKGHVIKRSSQENINNSRLAEAAGCSYQMARKYTLGMALPEIDIVLKISAWLDTSPAWLLFGENNYAIPKPTLSSTIEIEPDALKYVILRGTNLFGKDLDEKNKINITNFIFSSIKDISHLNMDSKSIRKVVDMLFNSTKIILSGAKENTTNFTNN